MAATNSKGLYNRNVSEFIISEFSFFGIFNVCLDASFLDVSYALRNRKSIKPFHVFSAI